MTTLEHDYSGLEEIRQRLAGVWLRRRMVRLATGAAAALTIILSSLMLVAAAGGFWPNQPPALMRYSLLSLCLAAWAAALGWILIRGVLWRQNPAQNARFIEHNLPTVRNDLINAVLLSRDDQQASPELVQAAIYESSLRAQKESLEKSISYRPLKQWSVAAAAATLTILLFTALAPGMLHRGLVAVFQPTAYVPAVNRIELLELTPGDATIFAEQDVAVTARIRNELGKQVDGRLLLDGQAERPLIAGERHSVFTCPLGKCQQTFRYAVAIGDSRWPADKPWYTVEVLTRVDIEGLDLTFEYPPYTGLKAQTVANAAGPINAPVGTQVKLTLRLSAAVPSVVLDVEGAAPQKMTAPMAADRTFTGTMTIVKDGNYRLLIKDAQNRTLQQAPSIDGGAAAPDILTPAGRSEIKGYYPIHAMPDPPPQVEFLAPNRDITAAPGGKVPMRIKASDKYGLSDVQVLLGPEKPAGAEKPVHRKDFPGRNAPEAVVEYEYTVPADLPDDGSAVLTYFATATDNRIMDGAAGPQTTTSRRFKITVQNARKVADEKARRFEELRQRLLALLKMQELQRLATEICWKKHTELPQILAAAAGIADQQRKIRSEMLDLVDKFPFEPNMAPIQTALALLANNEAQLAVDQAGVLAKLQAMAERDKACSLLACTQDKILDTLRTLLAILPSMADKIDQEKAKKPAEDLPPEAADKMRKLKDDLEKFIEDQRKVIEGSDRLAKKPVDNFTPEDQKLMKDLVATQDKWENFINEAFTDFSKLAQQDFSNPAMLKELLSVKSDVTMAKNALKANAQEIATAIEDNGIGNAKELTANLEKWLPDTPDRQKWEMEDPADGQANIEAPELPTELEDLVGDLLEQEEDLFEAMEDLSSKYTMSGDKGIGWDAMDGPISSMNAQGVTGNQLPNPNELSGRSGEGRSGQSSGEFVQDEAVGKGGRRTPTRLTPEPFQKGQVDDKSTEPTGGATGGGKLSGAGEEGLEGPVPPPLAQEMPRLAGQQASLLNKAERIQAQFKTKDFASFKLLEAITLMNQVQTDLSRYRYENALRAQKNAVAALSESKLHLTGGIDVTRDATSAMPKYIRDNIADAMQGKLPNEFRNVVEQYYRRLGQTADGMTNDAMTNDQGNTK